MKTRIARKATEALHAAEDLDCVATNVETILEGKHSFSTLQLYCL